MAHRIMIVDDHPMMRLGLRELLSAEPDFEVCGEAEGPAEALAEIVRTSPRLILVDISLREGSGIELIKRIRNEGGDYKILVLSMHEESLFALRALRAGAQGYINKRVATDQIVDAIRRVLAGKIYLNQELADRLLSCYGPPSSSLAAPAISQLTDRELEVFEMIGQALATREIAESLNLSIKTIETHRENIKRKLALDSHIQLVLAAYQWLGDQV